MAIFLQPKTVEAVFAFVLYLGYPGVSPFFTRLVHGCRNAMACGGFQSVNTVQSRAGHSKAGVTTDIYGHAMARSRQEAARMIEQIMIPLPNRLLSD